MFRHFGEKLSTLAARQPTNISLSLPGKDINDSNNRCEDVEAPFQFLNLYWLEAKRRKLELITISESLAACQRSGRLEAVGASSRRPKKSTFMGLSRVNSPVKSLTLRATSSPFLTLRRRALSGLHEHVR